MNYETEFELEALLYPLTRDEHIVACNAIIADRGARLLAERDEVSGFANARVRFLALAGIQAEMDKLSAASAAIKARMEESKPRRGRPPGSRTKRKLEVAGLDVRTHSDEPGPEAAPEPPQRRPNGHVLECLCEDCEESWVEEEPAVEVEVEVERHE